MLTPVPVTAGIAPLRSSVLKRRYVSLQNEWMNELTNACNRKNDKICPNYHTDYYQRRWNWVYRFSSWFFYQCLRLSFLDPFFASVPVCHSLTYRIFSSGQRGDESRQKLLQIEYGPRETASLVLDYFSADVDIWNLCNGRLDLKKTAGPCCHTGLAHSVRDCLAHSHSVTCVWCIIQN